MSDPDIPVAWAEVLRRHVAGEVPAGLTLAALVISDDPGGDGSLVRRLARLAARDPRLTSLADLAVRHREAPAAIRAVLAAVDHRPDPAAEPDRVIARLAAGFDAAALVDPAVSVAIYSLGDEARLAESTDEIVTWLAARDLLPPDGQVLEIGCGIGRFAPALAGRVGGYLGLDISPRMVETARARTAGLPATAFRIGSGHDLSGVAAGSVASVLVVDAFPYLVQAGGDVVRRCIQEVGRVLMPGGAAVVLNWSYRGDAEADRADAAALSAAAGMRLDVAGERPFRTWDGTAFVLAKPTLDGA